MVHCVCWMELTDSSTYGPSCVLDRTNMQLAYGVARGSSREATLCYFIGISSVTFYVSKNKCHITDIHLLSDLKTQQTACYTT